MHISATIGATTYRLAGPAIDLAIPLHFNGPQPNTYGVPPAEGKAYEDGKFIGEVKRGGSCNFETYTLVPHCNGTHTECVGHIANERIALHEVLTESFFPATLITVSPVSARDTEDTYRPALNPEDQVIDRAALEDILREMQPKFRNAVVVRTLPNDPGKMSRDYMKVAPPFFTNEAMAYLDVMDVQHLLVDMPSVDRLFDEGKLSNHHIFWKLKQGSHAVKRGNDRSMTRTITEMVYVPDTLADGAYLLELQVAPFMADAAPSRPRLWNLTD